VCFVSFILASKPQNGNYVFQDRYGNQLKGGTISHIFKRYVKKAGLDKGLHWHSLRHTGISWLINNGIPLTFVQRLAGHSSPVVTQAYAHLDEQNLALAVNVFPLMN
jgi:integrase/recombinase XerD